MGFLASLPPPVYGPERFFSPSPTFVFTEIRCLVFLVAAFRHAAVLWLVRNIYQVGCRIRYQETTCPCLGPSSSMEEGKEAADDNGGEEVGTKNISSV